MSKRKQKKRIIGGLAALLAGELHNGSEWIFGPNNENDKAAEIVRDLIREFRRRAQ